MQNNNLPNNHKQNNTNATFAWFAERFPPANLPGFALLFATIWFYSTDSGSRAEWDYLQLSLQLLAFIALFLMIRIIDEHKDYQHDLIHYPTRVLQSGRVTLPGLRRIAYGAALLIIAVHLIDRHSLALLSLLLLSVWLFLMTEEFFCHDWISNRPLLYATSHMLIMPFITLWVYHLVTPEAGLVSLLNSEIIYIGLFAFFGGFAGEVMRKFRAPDEVADYVDAYNHKHSDLSLLILTMASLNLMTIMCALLINQQFYSPMRLMSDNLLLTLGIAQLLFLIGPLIYQKKQTRKGRKLMTGALGMGMLLLYIALLAPFYLNRLYP